MLRSVGATKKQIKRNVFYEASILGMFGIPLGLLFGLLASFILVHVSNYLLLDMSDGLSLVYVMSIPALVIAVVLGTITIYLSAFGSAKRASKISPIDSIRNSSSIKLKKKSLKVPKFISKIFGIGGEISYKNLKRNNKKYRTTMISIAVSVLVFIGLYSFMTETFAVADDDLKNYNYAIELNSYGTSKGPDFYKKINESVNLDDVDNYTISLADRFNFKGTHYSKEYMKFTKEEKQDDEREESILIFTLGDYQYKKYIKSLGLKYEDVKDKAIYVDYLAFSNGKKTRKMKYFDFEEGDTISGKVSSKDVSIKVAKYTMEVPFGYESEFRQYFILSDEYFNEISESGNLTVYYDSENPDKLQDQIDEILKGEEYYLNNIVEEAKMYKNLKLLIGIFLYGFITVISLIGITNIFNAITANMQLRKQEFAMLKSVGMTSYEFRRMIRLESTFLGLKSLLYGLPIGIVISILMHMAMANDTGLPYKLPVFAIIISTLAVFLLISLIMRYSMSKIDKQNTIETIRNENI